MSPSPEFQYQPCDIPTPSWEEQSDTLTLSCDSQLTLPHRTNAVVISPSTSYNKVQGKEYLFCCFKIYVILPKGTEDTVVTPSC